MGAIASQITSLTTVYSTDYSDADQRKHQSSASLAFVQGTQRGPVISPHKWPVTQKMFLFHDVIMTKIYQTQLRPDSSHIMLDNVIVIICLQVEFYCLKLVFIELLISAWLPCLADLVLTFRLSQIKPVAMKQLLLRYIQVQCGSAIGRSISSRFVQFNTQ